MLSLYRQHSKSVPLFFFQFKFVAVGVLKMMTLSLTWLLWVLLFQLVKVDSLVKAWRAVEQVLRRKVELWHGQLFHLRELKAAGPEGIVHGGTPASTMSQWNRG